MNTTPHQSGTAASGDLNLFYRQFGEAGKTPILIAHGLSYFSYDWIDVATSLSKDREVVALDMRGFGDSDWSSEKDYSIPTNAKDFIAVMDHLGWGEAILMGHSLGGRFSSFCAAEYPDRISAYIAVDFAPEQAPEGSGRVARIVGNSPDTFESVEEAMQYFNVDPHTSQALLQRARFEEYLKPVDGRFMVKRDTVFRDNFKKILETGERPKPPIDIWDVLDRIKCKTLIIRGTKSDMFSTEIMEKVRQARPDFQIVEVDAGHDIAGENIEDFLAAVSSFLSEQNL